MYSLEKFDNSFEYLHVKNNSAEAKIALQGAHIFEFTQKNHENLLWLSKISDFKKGKAIRGGVPICWPSFGLNNPTLPQHGFARVMLFELQSVDEKDANTTEVIFRLTHSQESLALWNYKFELEVKFTLSTMLSIELTTTNKDNRTFQITQALHSYFAISDIANITIKGVKNKPRFDALTNQKSLQNEDITFNEEFDSVFQEVENEIILEDKKSVIHINNENSSSVIVWNPWIEKSSSMSAMSADAYREFVCVESANAFEDFKIIEPNSSHTLKATFQLSV